MQNIARILSNTLPAFMFLLASLPAQASSQIPFDAKAFKAAQESGNPVLVEIHADWCPTCRAQLPILNKLSGESEFSNIARFRVDFDNQKDVVRSLGAKMQSTLVLYKGNAEVARSVGETGEGNIRAMLTKAR